jgi:hypothetical protein
VQEIEAQQSQADVLKALLRGAVDFSDRVALFVIKNEQAIGWRLAKVDDPDLEMIGGVSLPLTAQTIVTRAARDRITTSGADAVDSDYAMLLDQLGGAPAVVTAMPLIVRGKVVAVLYADASSTDTNAMNVDALDLLTRVAAMAVNLVSIQRTAGVPAPAETTQAEAPRTEPAEEQAYIPQVEAAELPADTIETEPPPPPVEWTMEPVATESAASAEDAALPDAEPNEPAQAPSGLTPDVVSANIWGAERAAPATDEPTPTAPAHAPAPEAVTEPLAPPVPVGAPSPDYSSPYSAPLGSSRRYGVSEPELPVEVSEDERRLHNDARRFARLLVSEIKLYNEPKVQEGRNKGDLYDRLRDDIDRSRQMYNKRVAPPVAARHDYFHQELVNTLAEGDVTKLGMSYPGASLSAA